MRYLGVAMVSVGFLVGALIACLDRESVPWISFGLALGVSVAGVAILRVGARRAATDQSLLQSNIRDIEVSLTALVDQSRKLAEATWGEDVYELPDRIDRLFQEPLEVFVAARESIIHVHGVQAYAEVMSEFAAGERYLNRVWSAAAEGYVDEATTYLAKAYQQFSLAQGQLQRLAGSA